VVFSTIETLPSAAQAELAIAIIQQALDDVRRYLRVVAAGFAPGEDTEEHAAAAIRYLVGRDDGTAPASRTAILDGSGVDPERFVSDLWFKLFTDRERTILLNLMDKGGIRLAPEVRRAA
jgi:DNA-binding NarL/FixJ family response regulator